MSFDEDLQAMRKGREDLMRLSEEASERAMHVQCSGRWVRQDLLGGRERCKNRRQVGTHRRDNNSCV